MYPATRHSADPDCKRTSAHASADTDPVVAGHLGRLDVVGSPGGGGAGDGRGARFPAVGFGGPGRPQHQQMADEDHAPGRRHREAVLGVVGVRAVGDELADGPDCDGEEEEVGRGGVVSEAAGHVQGKEVLRLFKPTCSPSLKQKQKR